MSLAKLCQCSRFAEGSCQGHVFGSAFFTADLLAPFFALLFESPAAPSPCVTALAHDRPRRLVIGHVQCKVERPKSKVERSRSACPAFRRMRHQPIIPNCMPSSYPVRQVLIDRLETVQILEWVARRARRAEGKERTRRISVAGCKEGATTPFCLSASRPTGCNRFWRWPTLLARPRSLRMSALRSRLGQRQNRQQRGPLQYFNRLLTHGAERDAAIRGKLRPSIGPRWKL